jgi:hypothetical protein
MLNYYKDNGSQSKMSSFVAGLLPIKKFKQFTIKCASNTHKIKSQKYKKSQAASLNNELSYLVFLLNEAELKK